MFPLSQPRAHNRAAENSSKHPLPNSASPRAATSKIGQATIPQQRVPLWESLLRSSLPLAAIGIPALSRHPAYGIGPCGRGQRNGIQTPRPILQEFFPEIRSCPPYTGDPAAAKAARTPAPYAGSALSKWASCRSTIACGTPLIAAAMFENNRCFCSAVKSRKRFPACV